MSRVEKNAQPESLWTSKKETIAMIGRRAFTAVTAGALAILVAELAP